TERCGRVCPEPPFGTIYLRANKQTTTGMGCQPGSRARFWPRSAPACGDAACVRRRDRKRGTAAKPEPEPCADAVARRCPHHRFTPFTKPTKLIGKDRDARPA